MKKIQIDNTIYTANTDFRVAIKCNEIAQDETIGDYERVLGIICTMFGEEGINIPDHYEKLLKWALNYLSCGKEIEDTNEEPDMDFKQDERLIRNSFIYDYKYDPYEKEYLDWQDFYYDLCYLSNSEFGNCCALNRVRNLRNYDTSQIQDAKERDKIIKAKNQVALKKKEVKLTEEQQKSSDEFYKALGF